MVDLRHVNRVDSPAPGTCVSRVRQSPRRDRGRNTKDTPRSPSIRLSGRSYPSCGRLFPRLACRVDLSPAAKRAPSALTTIFVLLRASECCTSRRVARHAVSATITRGSRIDAMRFTRVRSRAYTLGGKPRRADVARCRD